MMVSKVLHPNQAAVANELGIAVAELESAEAAVDAIEARLGEASTEERARWFVISVLRHMNHAKWVDLKASGLDESRQRSLAKDCLAVEGFAASLRTVTKDNRSKFRIVGFASSKNLERGKLATGTKAYKIAVYVVVEAGLVEQAPQLERKKSALKQQRPRLEEVEKTVVGRRAKRRGYFNDEFMDVADAAAEVSSKHQPVSMSEEEFANLDAALNRSDTEIIQQNWGDQPREDRWSRILGVLAGVGFFVFVALLFL